MEKIRRKKGKKGTIFFTGGGTGGHLFPGIAVIQKLIATTDFEMENILWIGSGKELERSILGRFEIPYKAIACGKLRRYFSFQNFLDFFKIFWGFLQIFFYMLHHRPRLVFSKGGYVSVAPCLAAKILRIPCITHESDMTPGLATRINSRFVDLVLTAYPQTAQMIRQKTATEVVGNPVREEVTQGDRQRGRTVVGAPESLPVVLVLGGSLGASGLNRLVDEARSQLKGKVFLVHQRGEKDYLPQKDSFGFSVPFFADSFTDVLAAADLVVSRAGAGTLWENAVAGKPAILVPLGKASSRGDQIINAEYFSRLGAAEIMDEANGSGEALAQQILTLLNDSKKQQQMKVALHSIAGKNSAQLAVDCILKKMKGDRQ